MIEHPHLSRAVLEAYVSDRLPADRAARADRHLETCLACAAAAARLATLRQLRAARTATLVGGPGAPARRAGVRRGQICDRVLEWTVKAEPDDAGVSVLLRSRAMELVGAELVVRLGSHGRVCVLTRSPQHDSVRGRATFPEIGAAALQAGLVLRVAPRAAHLGETRGRERLQ